MRELLLAVDGSEHSMRAAKEAGDLARALNSSTLRIVVAFDNIPSYYGEPNTAAGDRCVPQAGKCNSRKGEGIGWNYSRGDTRRTD